MAQYFTHYILDVEEKQNIKKTCDILTTLEKNNTLNAHFNLSLIKELLELILVNENNKMKI